MRPRRYILEGHTPVPCKDLLTWGRWYEAAFATDDRAGLRVGLTDVGDARVSTVFLALDHNHSGVGPPLLFETMVCRGGQWEDQVRYATWEEAEAGHAAMVERVRAEGKP